MTTLLLLSVTGTLTFNRWRSRRGSTPNDERLRALLGATLSPLCMLACVAPLVVLFARPSV